VRIENSTSSANGTEVASGHTLTQAFGQAFWWTTGFTVLAVLASFFLPGRLITGN
jgi:ABC-type sugar transport system permease subunit